MNRGRKPTGRLRTFVSQISLTQEEHEYVARSAFEAGVTANFYMRQRIIPPLWRNEMERLRKEQKNIPVYSLDGRRHPR